MRLILPGTEIFARVLLDSRIMKKSIGCFDKLWGVLQLMLALLLQFMQGLVNILGELRYAAKARLDDLEWAVNTGLDERRK